MTTLSAANHYATIFTSDQGTVRFLTQRISDLSLREKHKGLRDETLDFFFGAEGGS